MKNYLWSFDDMGTPVEDKMSGGSYEYGCFKIEELYVGAMHDDEMNEMMKDLYNVLHDVEWWQSADIGEEDYRKTVKNFKDKWFGKRDENLTRIFINRIETMNREFLDR
jgi:hypothetical protein